MERLTKRISENIIELHAKANPIQYNGSPQRVHVKHPFWNVFNRLCDYETAEEQGLLLRLPIAVYDVVDKLFSHNELISLWREVKEETTYHKRIWYGMAWDIPDELKQCQFVKIFGTIPESIVHADIINIEVVLSSEAEKALAEMG